MKTRIFRNDYWNYEFIVQYSDDGSIDNQVIKFDDGETAVFTKENIMYSQDTINEYVKKGTWKEITETKEYIKTTEFDLEKALAGAKVTTKSGLKVQEIHLLNSINGLYPLIAVVEGTLHHFTERGKFIYGKDEDFDLVMAPTKKELWFNVYEDNIGERVNFHTGNSTLYVSKERALDSVRKSPNYIGTYSVEIEV